MADAATRFLNPEYFYAKVTGTAEFRYSPIEQPDFKVTPSRTGPGGFDIEGLQWHGIVLQCSSAVMRSNLRRAALQGIIDKSQKVGLQQLQYVGAHKPAAIGQRS